MPENIGLTHNASLLSIVDSWSRQVVQIIASKINYLQSFQEDKLRY